jgi:hypothetical protein
VGTAAIVFLRDGDFAAGVVVGVGTTDLQQNVRQRYYTSYIGYIPWTMNTKRAGFTIIASSNNSEPDSKQFISGWT